MKPRQKRILLWVATVVVALAGLVGLAFLATFYYLKPTLPDTAQLRELKLQVPLRVYSRDGRLLGQVGEQRRLPVLYEEIPPIVVQAFLAAEDDRFFSHPGVDWQGMVRATFVSATSLEARQGGSTITQQLVRTTLITKEKTLRRKLREIFLSLTLEHELEKQEILTLYLNTVFLGQRAYGVAAAAETYFGKPLADLNVAEAALLAGLPQAPSRYNPVTSPELATRRRGYVLRRMHELRYIDEPTYQAARRMPVAREVFGPRIQVDAPYVTELVRIALEARYGERLYSEGIKVVTTIDSQLQRAADVALRSAVLEYDRRHGYRGPAGKVAIAAGADAATMADLLENYPVVGGLQPAIVTAVRADGLNVITRGRARYDVPFEGIRWARRVDRDGRVGAAPKRPGDVATRGAVVYVLPDSPSTALLVQVPEAQGAFTALDPSDGAILALAGGFDYYAAKFNRVTQARRQPGSAFKPFVYSAALERGFTPATVILDAPVVFESGEAGDWRPENNEGRFYGPTRMREALVRSRNLVSIRIMRSLGVGYTRDYVQRFGFPAQHLPPDLTMALGTAQLTPLEVATGYAVFANGGYRVNPYLIDRVEDANGKVLMQADPLVACRECAPPAPAGAPGGAAGAADAVPAPASRAPAPAAAQVASFLGDGAGMTRAVDLGGGLPLPDDKHRAPQVITAANAFVMTDMMRDVIRRGTARRALALNREDIAGKTGTTNDRRDAWFSGFNADLVGTAWIGFDQERSLGDLEEGGRTALPMWIYFMREALRGHPPHRLSMPDGVVTARIRPATGQLADSSDAEATFEYFLVDHQPGSGGVEGVPGAPDTQKPDEEPLF